ncbi:Sucrase/ferredoxin-like-domain-containing protein [Massariosphaeria phaeospora]|uniref:Sucrase/ferredoxin-like-domain-containing protein n=1 Tax=Massariosphaeria phaeospora TaxID=100035 RepID=A0A7C8M355_9PLEO|nr:Sucrase/ferredoxin-like-domain-containing protein [Massariosphaeria phaeospora]
MSPSDRARPAKPFNAYRMTATLKNLYYKLTPSNSAVLVPTLNNGSGKNAGEFTKAHTTDALFPTTDPAVDGEECLRDCASCVVKYPNKFSIDETEELYGHVNAWSTHLIVATGKTDWVRDVADEKGSVMEAVDKGNVKPSNGKLMLSASNIPVPDHSDHSTTVLLLPAFQFIDNVTPANTPELITQIVNNAPTNTSPLFSTSPQQPPPSTVQPPAQLPPAESSSFDSSSLATPPPPPPPTIPSISTLRARPCPHRYLILLCSQRTRDARCGQSAPLLRRELERHLRPLGLYRDLHDERPGGVGIYFISHVGGHKFSANVMVYRKAERGRNGAQGAEPDGEEALAKMNVEGEDAKGEGAEVVLDVDKAQEVDGGGEAAQCIWLARIRPEDCENLIRYTVLQGKVVKPESQLRGGFDRSKQLTKRGLYTSSASRTACRLNRGRRRFVKPSPKN